MKFQYLVTLVFSAFLIIGLGACKHKHSHNGHSHEHSADTDKQGKEYTSKYICPMHCEGSGSAEAGTCPVCGMDYVLNEDHGHSHNGEDHDHSHNGDHNHSHNGDSKRAPVSTTQEEDKSKMRNE